MIQELRSGNSKVSISQQSLPYSSVTRHPSCSLSDECMDTMSTTTPRRFFQADNDLPQSCHFHLVSAAYGERCMPSLMAGSKQTIIANLKIAVP